MTRQCGAPARRVSSCSPTPPFLRSALALTTAAAETAGTAAEATAATARATTEPAAAASSAAAEPATSTTASAEAHFLVNNERRGRTGRTKRVGANGTGGVRARESTAKEQRIKITRRAGKGRTEQTALFSSLVSARRFFIHAASRGPPSFPLSSSFVPRLSLLSSSSRLLLVFASPSPPRPLLVFALLVLSLLFPVSALHHLPALPRPSHQSPSIASRFHSLSLSLALLPLALLPRALPSSLSLPPLSLFLLSLSLSLPPPSSLFLPPLFPSSFPTDFHAFSSAISTRFSARFRAEASAHHAARPLRAPPPLHAQSAPSPQRAVELRKNAPFQ